MKIKMLRTVECDGKEIAGGKIVDETQMTVGHMQSLVGTGWAEEYVGKKSQDIQLDDLSDSDSDSADDTTTVTTDVPDVTPAKPAVRKPVKKSTAKPARKR